MTKSKAEATAEAALIRRILYASESALPQPALLPQASTPGELQLDHEAALLLAHGLRAAVLPWYSKLTPDRGLLSSIARVIQSLLATLAQRLSSEAGQAALANLAGYEIAAILQAHFDDVRSAEDAYGTAAAQHASLNELYLARAPHAAISLPQGADGPVVDAAYVRALIEAHLQALLPKEHWESELERNIVRDVVVGIVRGNVLGRCAKPWFLVQSIHKVLDASGVSASAEEGEGLEVKRPSQASTTATPQGTSSLLAPIQRLWTLLVLMLSILLPPIARAYLDLFTPTRIAGTERRQKRRRRAEASTASLDQGSISAKHAGAWESSYHVYEPSESTFSAPAAAAAQASSAPEVVGAEQHLIKVAPLARLISTALELHSRALGRTLEHALLLASALGVGALVEARIDASIRAACDAASLAPIVRTTREAALPGGQLPPPAPPDPTHAEQREEFVRLVKRIRSVVPAPARMILLGLSAEVQERTLVRALSPFLAPPAASGPGPSSSCTLSELANVRTFLAVLERVSVLVEPSLEASHDGSNEATNGIDDHEVVRPYHTTL